MKIKLIKIPYCETDVNECTINITYPAVPLGIPILKSSLQTSGFKVNQDDISIKIFKKNFGKEKIRLDLFNDERRINNFIKTGSDLELEEEGLKILNMTSHKGFDLFGLSIEEAGNPSTVGIVSVLSHFIKEKYDVPIIAGGRTPHEVVNKLLLNNILDYWVVEGYYANQHHVFEEFCKKLETRTFSFDKIPSLKYNKSGKIITNNKLLEKDEFVTPDFEGLPLEMYRRNRKIRIGDEVLTDNLLVLPYFFIKGCPNVCAFCSNSNWKYFKANDINMVTEDLKLLTKKHGTKYFYFLNSSINPTKPYLKQLIASFIEQDVSIIFTDCACFKNMDGNSLAKLKELGAARLIYGLETASRRLQKYINKNLEIKKVEQLLKKTHDSGIWAEIEIIAGFPYENNQDIEQTVSFIKKNKRYIGQVNLFKFWLDGYFLKEPEKFCLKIIENNNERLHIPGNKRGFDEVGGLRWESKIKQTEKSYQKIKKVIREDKLKNLTRFPPEKAVFLAHVIDYMYKVNIR